MFTDYIKVMFLEKQTDKEFFNDFFEEKKIENKLCCLKVFEHCLSKKKSVKIH